MENTGHSDRELISMLSAEGKTAEQLADEAWQAVQAHRAAKARGEPFHPVLDLRPEDLSQQQGPDFRMDADAAQAQEVVVDRIGGIWARHPQRGWGYIIRGDSGENYLWGGWLDQLPDWGEPYTELDEIATDFILEVLRNGTAEIHFYDE